MNTSLSTASNHVAVLAGAFITAMLFVSAATSLPIA